MTWLICAVAALSRTYSQAEVGNCHSLHKPVPSPSNEFPKPLQSPIWADIFCDLVMFPFSTIPERQTNFQSCCSQPKAASAFIGRSSCVTKEEKAFPKFPISYLYPSVLTEYFLPVLLRGQMVLYGASCCLTIKAPCWQQSHTGVCVCEGYVFKLLVILILISMNLPSTQRSMAIVWSSLSELAPPVGKWG